MATTNLQSFDTHHDDMIHDAQLDYYGKKLATCSSDRSIKIFEIGENNQKLVAELKDHSGPVWQISWAHPRFGSILASCSYDHRVIIWKENQPNAWTKIFEHKHSSSVNCISWAPHDLGLILAAGSSDQTISVIQYSEEKDAFVVETIPDAHDISVNAISWAPAASVGSLTSNKNSFEASENIDVSKALVKQFVSGGADNQVKIWTFEQGVWNSSPLDKKCHNDWVRDVQWANNIGLPFDTIASCSQDGKVFIWKKESNGGWEQKDITPKWNQGQSSSAQTSSANPSSTSNAIIVPWKLSWSVTGNILAISSSDNQVTLMKEGADGEWFKLSNIGNQ